MKKDEIVTINGKRYRKLKTIWNGNLDWNNPLLDKGGDANASSISKSV